MLIMVTQRGEDRVISEFKKADDEEDLISKIENPSIRNIVKNHGQYIETITEHNIGSDIFTILVIDDDVDEKETRDQKMIDSLPVLLKPLINCKGGSGDITGSDANTILYEWDKQRG